MVLNLKPLVRPVATVASAPGEDLLARATARLQFNKNSPESLAASTRLKNQYGLPQEAELGLRLLTPGHLKQFLKLEQDLQAELALGPADRGGAVLKLISRVDPLIVEMVRSLQGMDGAGVKPLSAQPPKGQPSAKLLAARGPKPPSTPPPSSAASAGGPKQPSAPPPKALLSRPSPGAESAIRVAELRIKRSKMNAVHMLCLKKWQTEFGLTDETVLSMKLLAPAHLGELLAGKDAVIAKAKSSKEGTDEVIQWLVAQLDSAIPDLVEKISQADAAAASGSATPSTSPRAAAVPKTAGALKQITSAAAQRPSVVAMQQPKTAGITRQITPAAAQRPSVVAMQQPKTAAAVPRVLPKSVPKMTPAASRTAPVAKTAAALRQITPAAKQTEAAQAGGTAEAGTAASKKLPHPGSLLWRPLLKQIYSKFNPGQLNNLDNIMKKYQGNEEDLYSALSKKYGFTPGSSLFGVAKAKPTAVVSKPGGSLLIAKAAAAQKTISSPPPKVAAISAAAKIAFARATIAARKEASEQVQSNLLSDPNALVEAAKERLSSNRTPACDVEITKIENGLGHDFSDEVTLALRLLPEHKLRSLRARTAALRLELNRAADRNQHMLDAIAKIDPQVQMMVKRLMEIDAEQAEEVDEQEAAPPAHRSNAVAQYRARTAAAAGTAAARIGAASAGAGQSDAARSRTPPPRGPATSAAERIAAARAKLAAGQVAGSLAARGSAGAGAASSVAVQSRVPVLRGSITQSLRQS